MKASTLAVAALVLVTATTLARASDLVAVGGVFPADGREVGGYDTCLLADGTRLRLEDSYLHSGLRELRLVHRNADGERLSASVSVAFGAIDGWRLDCSESGGAVAAWHAPNEPTWRYRVLETDHRTMSEPRELSSPGAWIDPRFTTWEDGYAAAWMMYEPFQVLVTGFARDGSVRYGPLVVSAPSEQWVGSPTLGADAQGNVVAAWYRTTGAYSESSRVDVAALTPDGQALGSPIALLDEARFPGIDQGPEAVVAGPSGIFTVYWQTYDAGGLVGRRVAIGGLAEQATTTTTTTSTTLDDDPHHDFAVENGWEAANDHFWRDLFPRLAANGNGGFLLLWRGRTTSPRWYWYEAYQMSSASTDGGRRWSRPVELADEVTVVVDSGGPEWFGVAIDDVRVGDDESGRWERQLLLSSTTGGGSDWLPARPIAFVPASSDDDCYTEVNALAADRSASGVMLVVWAQSTECDYAGDEHDWVEVFSVRSDDDGQTWSVPAYVVPAGSFGTLGDLSLASAGQGHWLLGLQPYYTSSQMLRSPDDGATWEPAAPGWPAFECDDSGGCVAVTQAVAAVEGTGADSDIFAITSGDAGRTWSDPVAVGSHAFTDAAADGRPAVATDGEGRWTVVWSSHRDLGDGEGLDADLVHSVSTDGGRSWSAARAVSGSARSDGWIDDDHARIAFGAGSWVTAWEGTSPAERTPPYNRRQEVRLAVAFDGCGDGVVVGLEECDDGNRIDGDGCDRNCYATACRNGIATAGEECDDGNTLDDDGCVAECRLARCGDGFVRTGVEECDDGNADPADACTETCTNARCGDGIVAAGIEECDDGNTVNEDACPSTCLAARCGDGYIREGVEDCDDQNGYTGDACPAGCLAARCGDGYVWRGVELCDPADPAGGECPDTCGISSCGDADGDGEIDVDDSLEILVHSVGGENDCPMETCDVDSNVRINTRDALTTLGLAVGLPYPAHCNLGPWLTIRLQDDRTFGALQIVAETKAAPIEFPIRSGVTPVCESLVEHSFLAPAIHGTELHFGMISLEGFRGPIDLARCRVVVSGDVLSSQFDVRIVDATDRDGVMVDPPPAVVLRGILE